MGPAGGARGAALANTGSAFIVDSAIRALGRVRAMFPGAWDVARELRAAGRGTVHPGVFLTIDEWGHAIELAIPGAGTVALMRYLPRIATIVPWSYEQQIYLPSAHALSEALVLPPTANLAKLGEGLPGWGIYIGVPTAAAGLTGFFASLDWEEEMQSLTLQILLDSESKRTHMHSVCIGDWPLVDGVRRSIVHGADLVGASNAEIVRAVDHEIKRVVPLVALVLRACMQYGPVSSRPDPRLDLASTTSLRVLG